MTNHITTYLYHSLMGRWELCREHMSAEEFCRKQEEHDHD